ncbi:MAG: hypothetical protein L6408_04955 [Nanoarchaeota archaeon]|nr:hypothetical protein [Nanoarchaeota archaeon]
MDFTGLIIAVVIIAVIFLIMKFVWKTMKIVFLVGIILLVLGVWFYGYSGFFDKIDDIPELKIQQIARSITGCTSDEQCTYIMNSSDCRMVEGYCNNIEKEDNLRILIDEEIVESSCNMTNVVFNETIGCECKLHKEREGFIKQWLGKKIEEEAGYTYCWKKD